MSILLTAALEHDHKLMAEGLEPSLKKNSP